MYIPNVFEEPSMEVMHQLIRARPLATLVTLSSSGLNANHIPLQLSEAPAPFGTLRGHVARANPVWQDVKSDMEALVVFHGPDTYISPSWYATKKQTGKVVPTWNYAVVHAYGSVRIIDDETWLRTHLDALTAHNEAPFAEQWVASDAPPEYVERLIKAIVGLEIVITRLLGKWKVSQNQPVENQTGVVEGLHATGRPDAIAMAALVNARSKDSC